MIDHGGRFRKITPHIHWTDAPLPSLPGGIAALCVFGEVAMTNAEYRSKLEELDRLLNDPDVPMQPDRIWSLLADVSRPDLPQMPCRSSSAPPMPAVR